MNTVTRSRRDVMTCLEWTSVPNIGPDKSPELLLGPGFETSKQNHLLTSSLSDSVLETRVYISYNIPPTSVTSAFVPILTFLSPPSHSRACSRRCQTSSARRRRSFNAPPSLNLSSSSLDTVDSDGTTMINDNSVSRFADLEFKLVDPNNVRIGKDAEGFFSVSDDGDGDNHIPLQCTRQTKLIHKHTEGKRVPLA